MTLRPTSIAELVQSVTAHHRVCVRGGGTKCALAPIETDAVTLDLGGLSGLVEYHAEECTFTALAGTTIAEIERALAPNHQHLPFDPPLSESGATLGGTVAAGANGSCRYRFGGIRDFIIGATFVDGRGTLVRSGGKVVKNAAGFLLHQALVGSCGTLGVLAELTFKVFPAAESHLTVLVETSDIATAVALVSHVHRARVDVEALDIEPPGTLWVRIGGYREAMADRLRNLRGVLGPSCVVITDDEDAAQWRLQRAFGWVPPGSLLVRVPITLPTVPRLDATLAATGALRRYTVAGNLALIAWQDDPALLDALLHAQALRGQALLGPPGHAWLGARSDNPVQARLRTALDPDGRFAA